MTDKRKNNGGKRLGSGRKSLGERKSKTFKLPIHCSDWLGKQGNKNAAVVELIEKAIENEA
jgi:hypothetical protein